MVVDPMTLHVRSVRNARLTTCNYGLSRVAFRGPRRPTDGAYVACIGSSETFARNVTQPFPNLLEDRTGTVCINLGQQMAGPDLFLQDEAVRALIHDASAMVLQVMGAANLSNRFYKVHPRRNDRFIAPKPALRQLYPDVDFTDVAFTGHLLTKLVEKDPVRFSQVRAVLQRSWIRRMRQLVGLAKGPVHLLWFAPRDPRSPAVDGHDPNLVTPKMLGALEEAGAKLTTVIYQGRPGALPQSPDADDHRRVASALSKAMGRGLK